MTIDKYESLNEEDQKIVEDAARLIAWDWIGDHRDSSSTEEENQEWEDEIWSDFIKDVEE